MSPANRVMRDYQFEVQAALARTTPTLHTTWPRPDQKLLHLELPANI